MENLNVKKNLEKHSCKEHGEYPVVSITSDGLSLKCCCENFRSELIDLAKKYYAEEIKESIEDSLRGIFK